MFGDIGDGSKFCLKVNCPVLLHREAKKLDPMDEGSIVIAKGSNVGESHLRNVPSANSWNREASAINLMPSPILENSDASLVAADSKFIEIDLMEFKFMRNTFTGKVW